MTARSHEGRARPGSRGRRRCSVKGGLASALGLACALAASAAVADDLQQFELGKTRFDTGQYEGAAERFAAMLDPANEPCSAAPANAPRGCRITDPALSERARTLYVASLIALKRSSESETQIELILRQNPSYSPDPAIFPAEVLDRFTAVRARLRDELRTLAEKKAEEDRQRRAKARQIKEEEQRWIQALVKAASEEHVIVKNSRFIAALPFGVGQFQNGDRRLGWVFALSEAATGALSLVSSGVFTFYGSYDPRKLDAEGRNAQTYNQTIWRGINIGAFSTWAALSVVGVVQAQVAFVPEKVTIRQRPVPERPKRSGFQIAPTFTAAPGAAGLGVVGTF
jgi:hypothetical protein